MNGSALENGHVGLVKALDGGYAMVEFMRSKACAHCGACMSLDSGKMEARVKNTLGAAVGDFVSVEIRPQKIVAATLLGYGIPLVMLLAGIAAGSLVSELVSIVAGLGLCAISYLVLHRLEPRFSKNAAYQPKMTRIVPESELEENDHE